MLKQMNEPSASGTIVHVIHQKATIFPRSIHHSSKTVEQCFWEKVVKKEWCWEWTGSTRYGYGYLFRQIDRKIVTISSHRISWQIHNGSIQEGMQVLHRCDNPPCTNPEHLFLGTQRDNMADKVFKGRHPKGIGAPQSKLTDDKIENIRRRYSSWGTTYQKLANEYCVSVCTICNIINRKTWKHVI